MALRVTKTSQFLQQCESALLDDSVVIDADTLGTLAATVVELLRVVVDFEDRGRLYANMSRIRRRQGRMREALDAAMNAYHIDKTSAAFNNGVGAILGEMDRHKDALVFIDRAERLLKHSPDPAIGVSVSLNQAAARSALRQPGADEAFARAEAWAAGCPVEGNLKIADVLAAGGHPAALEFVARYLCARLGVPRGRAPAEEVLWCAPQEMLDALRAYPTLAPLIEAHDGPPPLTDEEIAAARERARRPDGSTDALAFGAVLAVPMRGTVKSDDHASDDLDDNDLPPAPTEEEIAAATEKARRPDGTVNPYALAAALAVPMKGRVRSDDRGAPGRR